MTQAPPAAESQADPLVIAGRSYSSRLLVGTGKYRDFDETRMAIQASGAEIVTVAIRRTNIGQDPNEPNLLDVLPLQLRDDGVHVLRVRQRGVDLVLQHLYKRLRVAEGKSGPSVPLLVHVARDPDLLDRGPVVGQRVHACRVQLALQPAELHTEGRSLRLPLSTLLR